MLLFVRDRTDHRGFPPSLREVSWWVRSSVRAVRRDVLKMAGRELLRVESGRARTVRLTGAGHLAAGSGSYSACRSRFAYRFGERFEDDVGVAEVARAVSSSRHFA